MSPASKSKSKDRTIKAVKEHSKTALKSSAPPNNGNGVPGSAYNPISGTFHTIEIAPSPSLPTAQSNGRFRTIDETEEHSGSSLGTTAEYDSLSNNDGCSVESEDQKEKATSSTNRTEPIPGSDTDKRDKIRQKNERKHQRQKERRAQELHERCNGYLMSRKLEALAQTLVAMGFSSERATMALILNEGRVEESVAWLFEGSEESKQHTAEKFDSANLKIDISDELAQIAALEIKYKCTKQEVERAVVACEGDLEKAEDSLKMQKQEATSFPPRLELLGDTVASVNEFGSKMSSSAQSTAVRTLQKGVAPVNIPQQRRDERDFNYTKTAAAGNAQIDANKNLQATKKTQLKQDFVKAQVATPIDKRWPGGSSSPPVSYSLPSPLQVAVTQAKLEARFAMGGHEAKTNMQAGTLKEPIIVMQRPQSVANKQNVPSTSIGFSASPPASTGWYPNGTANIEMMKIAAANGGLGQRLRNLSLNSSTSQQLYPQYQPFVSSSMEPSMPGWGGTWNNAETPARTTASLAVPSSLGLFTGWGSSGSSGSSASVDWSTGGSMPQCDYSRIDWSLDSTTLRSPALRSNPLCDSRSSTFTSARASRPAVNGDLCLTGLQDGSLINDPSTSVGSHEWTSPFNGEDLFRAPRKFVTSPSL